MRPGSRDQRRADRDRNRARLCALAAKNAERNGFGDKVDVLNADVTAPGKSRRATGLLSESYDQVIANPPFHAEGKVRQHPIAGGQQRTS